MKTTNIYVQTKKIDYKRNDIKAENESHKRLKKIDIMFYNIFFMFVAFCVYTIFIMTLFFLILVELYVTVLSIASFI